MYDESETGQNEERLTPSLAEQIGELDGHHDTTTNHLCTEAACSNCYVAELKVGCYRESTGCGSAILTKRSRMPYAAVGDATTRLGTWG